MRKMMPCNPVPGLPGSLPQKPPFAPQDEAFSGCLFNIESSENQEKPDVDNYVTLVHSCEKSSGSKPSKGGGYEEEDESSDFS
jgi:hypothetical protein